MYSANCDRETLANQCLHTASVRSHRSLHQVSLLPELKSLFFRCSPSPPARQTFLPQVLSDNPPSGSPHRTGQFGSSHAAQPVIQKKSSGQNHCRKQNQDSSFFIYPNPPAVFPVFICFKISMRYSVGVLPMARLNTLQII